MATVVKCASKSLIVDSPIFELNSILTYIENYLSNCTPASTPTWYETMFHTPSLPRTGGVLIFGIYVCVWIVIFLFSVPFRECFFFFWVLTNGWENSLLILPSVKILLRGWIGYLFQQEKKKHQQCIYTNNPLKGSGLCDGGGCLGRCTFQSRAIKKSKLGLLDMDQCCKPPWPSWLAEAEGLGSYHLSTLELNHDGLGSLLQSISK